MIEKNCLHCKKKYKAKRERSKYCSTRCRVAAYRKREKVAENLQPA